MALARHRVVGNQSAKLKMGTKIFFMKFGTMCSLAQEFPILFIGGPCIGFGLVYGHIKELAKLPHSIHSLGKFCGCRGNNF